MIKAAADKAVPETPTPTPTPTQTQTHSFLRSTLGVQLPLHISLSAPLVLETGQREGFLSAVRAAVEGSGNGDVGAVRSFSVRPRAVSWVKNFDGTRWFLVLRLTRPGGDELGWLLRACNACAEEFGLPLLYQGDASGEVPREDGERDDCFHISIAWTLSEPSEEARIVSRELLEPGLREAEITFDTVKVKIGNVVHDLPLRATTPG